jgi:KUP system potassium uptake protein
VARAKATDAGGEPGETSHDARFWTLLVGSIGVVFGDIGTSPLYAFREAVRAASGGSPANADAVFGVLSLIFWALILIVTLKYVLVLLRADNKGEGGTFALMALGQKVSKRSTHLLLVLGIAGASFFYGDAVHHAAISVLSAVEGIKLVSPVFEPWVVPIALVIIVALFSVQSHARRGWLASSGR